MFGRKKEPTTREALAADLTKTAHAEKAPWIHMFLSLTASDSVGSVTGFFYKPDGSWRFAKVVRAGSGTWELFERLREESRAEERVAWDGVLVRLDRGASEPEFTFLYGAEAEEWEVTPTTLRDIVEKGRPR